MRAHGLPDFPDPNSQGRFLVNVHPGSDLSPSAPQYRSANKTCRHLLPDAGRETPSQERQELKVFLAYSRCMRSHGVSSFPDPTLVDGHAALIQKGGGGDQNSPEFQRAERACEPLSPGG
jgi:hypothetical protein